ncbi:MAG: hypothetical protein DMF73_03790 [Acidobacteria bacterium]|nr:MAG: hypothetical protein DMF73_03790 [Acidobacteriota bacterium]
MLLSLLVAMFCTCVVANAQSTSCPLKPDQLANAPELFGVRLGMTPPEVKTLLPLVQFGRPDPFGVMKTSFNPHFDSRVDKTAFPDVRTISLEFLDGKLVTLWIGYEATFKWPKLDQFVANFSKSLSVPADWPVKRNGRELSCDGFSLFASIIGGGPGIRITDDTAQDLIAARVEAALDAEEKEVIGDIRTRSYYTADCAARDQVPQASRAVFKNKDEAEKAGYTLSKDCH